MSEQYPFSFAARAAIRAEAQGDSPTLCGRLWGMAETQYRLKNDNRAADFAFARMAHWFRLMRLASEGKVTAEDVEAMPKPATPAMLAPPPNP